MALQKHEANCNGREGEGSGSGAAAWCAVGLCKSGRKKHSIAEIHLQRSMGSVPLLSAASPAPFYAVSLVMPWRMSYSVGAHSCGTARRARERLSVPAIGQHPQQRSPHNNASTILPTLSIATSAVLTSPPGRAPAQGSLPSSCRAGQTAARAAGGWRPQGPLRQRAGQEHASLDGCFQAHSRPDSCLAWAPAQPKSAHTSSMASHAPLTTCPAQPI